MRRTDLLDKDDWIHAQVTRRLQSMTPSRRFQIAVELSEAGMRISLAAEERLTTRRGQPGLLALLDGARNETKKIDIE